jgi:hypothetical protein
LQKPSLRITLLSPVITKDPAGIQTISMWTLFPNSIRIALPDAGSAAALPGRSSERSEQRFPATKKWRVFG